MPVELTDSAKRKLADAQRKGLLGKGKAAKAAGDVIQRKTANSSALDIARKSLNARRNAQTTDSNN